MKRLTIPFLCLCLICAGRSEAQSPRQDSRPTVQKRLDAPFRLRFANTDVSDVLQALSLKTKASIVFPSQIKKPISVEFTAASAEEALKYVTAAAGLSFRLMGKTYVVAPSAEMRTALEPFGERVLLPLNTMTADEAVKLLENGLPYATIRPTGNQVLVIGGTDDIAQARQLLSSQDKVKTVEPMGTEVVVLQNAPANQIANLLKTMFIGLKAESVGALDKPGGVIGLSGTKTQLAEAKDAVKSLDVQTTPREQGKSYRVYPIHYSSAPVLLDFMTKAAPNVNTLIGPESYSPLAPGFRPLSGASLGTSSSSGGSSGSSGGSGGASGSSTGGGSSPGAATAKEGDRAKTLVLNGTPEDLDAAFKLLAMVDTAPKQVMVEVKVVDTSPENAEQIGVQWNFNPLNFFETAPNTSVGTIGQTTKPAGIGQFSRIPFSFGAQLSAMVTRKEAKILADPRIQVVDNEDANIFIGDTIRTQVAQSSISGTTIQVLEFPIGIILLVRPRVNEDGRITMRVHPVVSTITGFSSNNIPQTSSREAETTVMVRDGETIVLGGLIRDEMIKTVQEVPLLSKLPLVGELFRYRNNSRRHSEIMVFITPHIIPDKAP